ncbi:MAG: type I-E CRISPR-associated protein Cse1/CasA [Candidatus Pacebacteria bacterium]|jgi:CRISPR system Cascade subunit CasA|nr:type I-E CRISPR-associated protein Cse1/CasA [Candidatus Paceibacterota bacterium]
MKSFNLLTENWIPVQQQGQFETISLKRLLCRDEDWQICMSRDDMELAALQLIVCIVQVVFMPDDEDCLMDAYKKPMNEADYDKGILSLMEWFDVLHPKYPFMQTANVKPEIKNKKVVNWASIQKLFVGLPEESSTSESSNAFFNAGDEIDCISFGESVIALFQQATNGFSLGGRFYSVGLKGSMPITTLIQESSLRKCIWCNVINKDFLKETSSLLDGDKNNQPTWVVSPSFDSKSPEYAHTIGLLRGLFWQPARVKLDVDDNFQVKGFFKEQGMSYVKDFWQHPHTPIDIIRLKNNNQKEKPFLSAKQDLPLWGQMLSFFYTQSTEQEGFSRALVVSHYAKIVGRKKSINLAVGGYVQGNSTESLAGRKHEMYSISSGWENQIAEMSLLISYGLDAQKALDYSIYSFGKELREIRIVRNKEKPSKLITNLMNQAKNLYFNNSEEIFHSIMRELDVNDVSKYNDNFVQLAIGTFDTIFLPYEHDPKLLKAIVMGRKELIKKLMKIGGNA